MIHCFVHQCKNGLNHLVHLSESDEDKMIKLTVTGCGFSFVGTMLTLCLLCFLPVGSDGMFILSNMSVSLLSAQIAFIGAENSNPNGMVCKSSTAILHYLFLCLQFSSLRYALHLIGKLKPHNLIDKSQKKFTIILFVWGLPFLVVAITAILRGDTYGKDELCWLSNEHGTRWAFLGPVVIIQIINWIVFIMMLITRMVVDLKKNGNFLLAAKKQVLTACSLIPVLGLTWSLGFSVTTGRSMILQYLFVFFTSTQAVPTN
ncbi:hypothetical protein KUTeg_018945 [Tegillarca granosa]|uniref:G-protein coupled receptors family 2 profile 2 domain-containing protein n=1 Tax=Tegillarca granosa TaxID=220873 RepID=A0ABQ9ED88_TEGGR|nr:hypothetical protein KUTeg_018945 [Tegillarca granosa]